MTTPLNLHLIAEHQATELEFLRHIFVRDQMAEWSKNPLVMARADGVHYWDVAGNRYLDALSGIYVVSVGHNNPRVLQAVQQQLQRLAFSPPMHGTNPVAVQLAHLLAQLAPGDLDTVKFASGGSESTEAAIKLARQYHRLTGNPGKYKIISRYQSWHGSTLGSLAASGLKSRKSVNEPLPPGFIHVFPPTCFRCPFDQSYPSCNITCARLIEQVIDQEDPATVAAVIVEPIGHTGGVIDPPDEYLPLLRDICSRHNVLLIFDEIITGVGRTGRLFAAETFGVVPDLLCLAKGLSGGYAPLAALLIRQPIARAFWGSPDANPGFVEGHTFEGNPIACAAGIAVLQEILDRDLLANARARGAQLRAGLENLARQHQVIGDIRGRGLFLAVEFVQDRASRQRLPNAFGTALGKRCLELGLLTRFDPHWIAFGPPLTFSPEDVDHTLAIFERALVLTLASQPLTARQP
jgi:adenosylmethionine-8-amino-7-oxononanoate aminotransferase